MKSIKLTAVLFVSGMIVSAAPAGLMIQPTGAAASCAVDGSRYPTKATDGSGLSDTTIVETGDPVPAVYPSHGLDSGDMWRSPNGNDGIGEWISFELGAAYDLTGFHLWNYNEIWTGDSYDETQRGIQVATVEYSTDNGTNWTSLGDMIFAQATGSSSYAGDDYSFDSPLAGVTDVRFTVVSNFNDANRSGISEVRFIGTPVPEPATMALLGLGCLGLLGRKK